VSILASGMRAEFYREGDADETVGVAEWDGRSVRIDASDREIRRILTRVFRHTPVSVTDPKLADPAASPVAQVTPGDLHWFRTAASIRGEREGLRVRFTTETPGGWDPAGAYRPLAAWEAVREGEGPPPKTLGTSRA
jgi:hypothetical protein